MLPLQNFEARLSALRGFLLIDLCLALCVLLLLTTSLTFFLTQLRSDIAQAHTRLALLLELTDLLEQYEPSFCPPGQERTLASPAGTLTFSVTRPHPDLPYLELAAQGTRDSSIVSIRTGVLV